MDASRGRANNGQYVVVTDGDAVLWGKCKGSAQAAKDTPEDPTFQLSFDVEGKRYGGKIFNGWIKHCCHGWIKVFTFND